MKYKSIKNRSFIRSLWTHVGFTLFVCVFAYLTFAQEPRQLVVENTQVANKRTAFVIGNGDYQNARKRANDANDMTTTLSELRFDVSPSETNVGAQCMRPSTSKSASGSRCAKVEVSSTLEPVA